MRKCDVGFIGAGQMAEAIARGIIEAGLYSAGNIMAADVSEERRRVFATMGVAVTADNVEVVRKCRTIVVAVKPQNLNDLLPLIGPEFALETRLISICAGVATGTFEKASKSAVRVIRAMPNLPVKVKAGAAALCAGRHARKEDMDLALRIFGAVGRAVIVEERLMDAVTALSGSGPAYVYFLVEAMIEAGVKEGLAPDVARELAVQTIVGAGAMLQADPASPEEHRRRVTSKGGTTEAAFKKMEEARVKEGLLAALAAAAERGRELGRGK